jgi:hypothetical protein
VGLEKRKIFCSHKVFFSSSHGHLVDILGKYEHFRRRGPEGQ